MVYDLADQVSFVGSMTAPLAFWDAAGAFDYGGAGASKFLSGTIIQFLDEKINEGKK